MLHRLQKRKSAQEAFTAARAQLETTELEPRAHWGQRHNDISVGVFFNPDNILFSDWEAWNTFGFGQWSEDFGQDAYEALRDVIIIERTDDARQALIENLTAQVQEFINRLQTEGIL